MLRFIILIFFISLSAYSQADEYLRHRILDASKIGIDAKFGNSPALMGDTGNTMADQIQEMISGPPNQTVKLNENVYFFSACRIHYCEERGAVIVNLEEGGLLIGAWRFAECSDANGIGCKKVPKIKIYKFSGWETIRSEAEREFYQDRINEWIDVNSVSH